MSPESLSKKITTINKMNKAIKNGLVGLLAVGLYTTTQAQDYKGKVEVLQDNHNIYQVDYNGDGHKDNFYISNGSESGRIHISTSTGKKAINFPRDHSLDVPLSNMTNIIEGPEKEGFSVIGINKDGQKVKLDYGMRDNQFTIIGEHSYQ